MRKAFIILLLVSISQICFACTTFLLKGKDQLVFGRNYDWITGQGVLNTNQRGLFKTSITVKDQKTISWTSKYGSLTFNQYGKEFPTGGMNEKGLVVELMWLDGTQYASKDDRAALNVLQWLQYQLDNCSTIEEVIASDKLVRISNGEVPLHYLIADANGNAATIEFLKGKMVVHKGKDLPFPVLTNHDYGYSLDKMKENDTDGNNSLERFATACSMVKEFRSSDNTSSINYSFNILKAVAQGNYTKWSIVYDIKNKQIYFKTDGHADIKTISFADIDFSCNKPAKSFLLNQDVKGDIKSKLVDHTSAINEASLRSAAQESAERVHFDEQEIMALVNYAKDINCKK